MGEAHGVAERDAEVVDVGEGGVGVGELLLEGV